MNDQQQQQRSQFDDIQNSKSELLNSKDGIENSQQTGQNEIKLIHDKPEPRLKSRSKKIKGTQFPKKRKHEKEKEQQDEQSLIHYNEKGGRQNIESYLKQLNDKLQCIHKYNQQSIQNNQNLLLRQEAKIRGLLNRYQHMENELRTQIQINNKFIGQQKQREELKKEAQTTQKQNSANSEIDHLALLNKFQKASLLHKNMNLEDIIESKQERLSSKAESRQQHIEAIDRNTLSSKINAKINYNHTFPSQNPKLFDPTQYANVAYQPYFEQRLIPQNLTYQGQYTKQLYNPPPMQQLPDTFQDQRTKKLIQTMQAQNSLLYNLSSGLTKEEQMHKQHQIDQLNQRLHYIEDRKNFQGRNCTDLYFQQRKYAKNGFFQDREDLEEHLEANLERRLKQKIAERLLEKEAMAQLQAGLIVAGPEGKPQHAFASLKENML